MKLLLVRVQADNVDFEKAPLAAFTDSAAALRLASSLRFTAPTVPAWAPLPLRVAWAPCRLRPFDSAALRSGPPGRVRGLLRTRLTRGAAGLVEPGNRDARDPRRLGEHPSIARIHDGNGVEIVFVDQFDQLAEPRADDDDIGRGKRQGQPLRCIQSVLKNSLSLY